MTHITTSEYLSELERIGLIEGEKDADGFTSYELAEREGYSVSTAERRIKRWLTEGRIVRSGSKRLPATDGRMLPIPCWKPAPPKA